MEARQKVKRLGALLLAIMLVFGTLPTGLGKVFADQVPSARPAVTEHMEDGMYGIFTKVQYADEDGAIIDENTTLESDQLIAMRFAYRVVKLDHANQDTAVIEPIVLDIPDVIDIAGISDGVLTKGSNPDIEYGHYSFDSSMHQLTLTFDGKDVKSETDVSGEIRIAKRLQIQNMSIGVPHDTGDGYNRWRIKPSLTVKLKKLAYNADGTNTPPVMVDFRNKRVKYTIDVNTEFKHYEGTQVISDQLEAPLYYKPNSFKLYQLSKIENGLPLWENPVSVTPGALTINDGAGNADSSFILSVPNFGNKAYRLEYEATYPNDAVPDPQINNVASFDGETSAAQVKFETASGVLLEKNGTAQRYRNPQYIDWTLTANKKAFVLRNTVITDEIPAGLTLAADTLVVKDSDDKIYQPGIDYNLTLPAEENQHKLTIDFVNDVTKQLTIDYRTTSDFQYGNSTANKHYTNAASLDSTDGHTDAKKTVSVRYFGHLDKRVTKIEGKYISYKLLINASGNPQDFGHLVIKDHLKTPLHFFDKDSVKLYRAVGENYAKGDEIDLTADNHLIFGTAGDVTQPPTIVPTNQSAENENNHLMLTIPENVTADKAYIVEYKTHIESNTTSIDLENEARLWHSDWQNGDPANVGGLGTGRTWQFKDIPAVAASVSGTGTFKLNKNARIAQGDTIIWRAFVQRNYNYVYPAGLIIKDQLSSDLLPESDVLADNWVLYNLGVSGPVQNKEDYFDATYDAATNTFEFKLKQSYNQNFLIEIKCKPTVIKRHYTNTVQSLWGTMEAKTASHTLDINPIPTAVKNSVISKISQHQPTSQEPYIEYTIELLNDQAERRLKFDVLQFEDILSPGMTVDADDIQITYDGAPFKDKFDIDVDQLDAAGNRILSFRYTGNAVLDKNIVIQYTAQIHMDYVKYEYSSPALGSKATLKNTVKLTRAEYAGHQYEALSSETSDNFSKAWSASDSVRGSVTIKKFDQSGAPLSGAEFQLVDNAGFKVSSFVMDDGVYTIGNLPYGNFRLKEIAPPGGYVVVGNDTTDFKIKDNNGLTHKDESDPVIKIVNRNVAQPLTYKVTHSFVSGTTGKSLPEVVLDLVPDDQLFKENSSSVSGTVPDATEVSVSGGKWVFKGYDSQRKRINNGDVNFVGTWQFEPTKYQAAYSFVSGTQGKVLPLEVTVLLPAAIENLLDGATVTAMQPSASEVAVSGGKWVFKGYDKNSKTINQADVNFVGTWQFEPTKYVATHSFVSGTPGKVLPPEVTNLLPAAIENLLDGATVTAMQPSASEVAVSGGKWVFKGYDQNSKTINQADVNFEGIWQFKPTEYQATHSFVSGTQGKVLPPEVTNLLPNHISGLISGDTATAIQPSSLEVVVATGKWLFKGYQPESILINNQDVEFVGTWQFVEASRYRAIHSFVSGTASKSLPPEVIDLLPGAFTDLLDGSAVTAVQPAQSEVVVADGKWVFKGYDRDSKTIAGSDANFIGTWQFVEAPKYKAIHRFVSGTADKVLPQAVLDLLPATIADLRAAETVNATLPTTQEVVVSDGRWVFNGYDKLTEKIVDKDVEFIGDWLFIEADKYEATHHFVSADNSKALPTEVIELLPDHIVGLLDGAPVTATLPDKDEVVVFDGKWIFKGYDADSKVIAAADVSFEGVWEFIAADRYRATHSFVSGTPDRTLPQAVLDLLPEDITELLSGQFATAVQPDELEVVVIAGKWVFSGYADETKQIIDGNVNFEGVWQYVEAPRYSATHRFVSATPDRVLPSEVTDLLPGTINDLLDGSAVTATRPARVEVIVREGRWDFLGYNADSQTVAAGDVNFEGVWQFTKAQTYSATHSFISALPERPLPQAVRDLLPAALSGFFDGDTVTATQPAVREVRVADGRWVFDGYDQDDKKIDSADVNFVGTWRFIEANKYRATHNFVSGTADRTLPQAVRDLVPSDISGLLSGNSVSPTAPRLQRVIAADGEWLFDGYDVKSALVGNKDVSFVGVWRFVEAEKYKAVHRFVSADSEQPLPREVLDLLPRDIGGLLDGSRIDATMPLLQDVNVSGGKWQFEGYDATTKQIAAADVTFVGTWKFVKEVVSVYKLGNYVWHDANRNGRQDDFETGVAGISVTLQKRGETIAKTVKTDQNGHYLFGDLEKGNYTVKFGNIPAAYSATTSNRVADDTVDSDGVLVDVAIVDADNLTIDLGIVKNQLEREDEGDDTRVSLVQPNGGGEVPKPPVQPQVKPKVELKGQTNETPQVEVIAKPKAEPEQKQEQTPQTESLREKMPEKIVIDKRALADDDEEKVYRLLDTDGEYLGVVKVNSDGSYLFVDVDAVPLGTIKLLDATGKAELVSIELDGVPLATAQVLPKTNELMPLHLLLIGAGLIGLVALFGRRKIFGN